MKQPITDLRVRSYEDEVCVEIEASPTEAMLLSCGTTEIMALNAASRRLGRLKREVDARRDALLP